MEIICTETLSNFQKKQILNLWNNEYPARISYHDIDGFEKYLESVKSLTHYLILDNQMIVGWGTVFIRENKNWFSIILDSKIHSKGHGTLLLAKMKLVFKELNGWVVDHNEDYKADGSIYKSPLDFYLKNGFRTLNNSRIENEKISAIQIVWNKESLF